MTKRIDPDIKALRACVKGLNGSSCRRMLLANLEFLWDRYVRHPTVKDIPRHLTLGQP